MKLWKERHFDTVSERDNVYRVLVCAHVLAALRERPAAIYFTEIASGLLTSCPESDQAANVRFFT